MTNPFYIALTNKLQPSVKNEDGFTLIELLVVIGILAILLAITIVAINPTLQFQNARNAQRQSDVAAILDGVYEYQASNAGAVPSNLSSYISTTVAKNLGALPNQTATSTTFANPNLTYTVPSGNIITSGTVTVTSCTQAGDNGTFPVVSGTLTTIVVTNAGGSVISATGCVIAGFRIDLCSALVPTFIAALPMDPSPTVSSGAQCALTFNTGYTILSNAAGNRYTVAAPGAEAGATISITR
ncbi:type II secretion system protein [Aeromicrobium sp.]|nr:type II secretion system protein [Candidatus Saccharibacteria bacterium]